MPNNHVKLGDLKGIVVMRIKTHHLMSKIYAAF